MVKGWEIEREVDTRLKCGIEVGESVGCQEQHAFKILKRTQKD